MLVDQVAQLPPLERFLYWIKERHLIHLRREAGQPKPWTDDKVLQSWFFTNPYRENDKVTRWFRENIRDPLRGDPRVLMATVIFRWFNLPSTGALLTSGTLNLLLEWNPLLAANRLTAHWNDGATPIFTGAYQVKAGNGPRGSKIMSVCDAITKVWNSQSKLIQVCREDCRLQALWAELIRFLHLGPFMAYEVVTDLRYTSLLENAIDVNTWSNPGPGASRGFNRLFGRDLYAPVSGDRWLTTSQELLEVARGRLPEDFPPVEMRVVEHSLCEWDKYERARLGSGKMKRLYNGV